MVKIKNKKMNDRREDDRRNKLWNKKVRKRGAVNNNDKKTYERIIKGNWRKQHKEIQKDKTCFLMRTKNNTKKARKII